MSKSHTLITIIIMTMIFSGMQSFYPIAEKDNEDNTPLSADTSIITGNVNVNIDTHEELYTNYVYTNINDFDVNHPNWNANKMTLTTSNIKDQEDITEIIQDNTGDLDEFGLANKFVINGITKQEVGSNFSVSHDVDLKYFDIAMKLDNIGNQLKLNFAGNTTIEIREDNNNKPYENINLFSVLLKDCVVISYPTDTSVEGQTIQHILQSSSLDSMLNVEPVIIRINVDHLALEKNIQYWVMINGTKGTIDNFNVYQRICLYDDNIETSNFVNRSYDVTGSYSVDHSRFINTSESDMYLVLNYRITEALLPTERSLVINSQVIPDSGIKDFTLSTNTFTTFIATPNNIIYNVDVKASLYKDRNVDVNFDYEVDDDKINWTGTINALSSVGTKIEQNMTITIPSHWTSDGFVLHEKLTTESSMLIEAQSDNCIDILYINGTTFECGSDISVNASGLIAGNFVSYSLWKDNIKYDEITNKFLNNIEVLSLSDDLENGTYTLVAKFIDANGNVGYKEINIEIYVNGMIIVHLEDQYGNALIGKTIQIANTTYNIEKTTDINGNITMQLMYDSYTLTYYFNTTIHSYQTFNLDDDIIYIVVVLNIPESHIIVDDDDDNNTDDSIKTTTSGISGFSMPITMIVIGISIVWIIKKKK